MTDNVPPDMIEAEPTHLTFSASGCAALDDAIQAATLVARRLERPVAIADDDNDGIFRVWPRRPTIKSF